VVPTPPPPFIRLALPDEYDAVGHLLVRGYAAISGMPVNEGLIAELTDVRGRSEDCVVLVALEGDTVVGTVTYVPSSTAAASEFDDPDGAGIRMLAVDPESRRSGLGRALTEECLRHARAAGRTTVYLHTTRWMKGAQRMYESMGFRRDTTLDWTPEPEVDLLGYRYRLQ
jgi:ribosomal protein S18 acetylase RimI-like enzyme